MTNGLVLTHLSITGAGMPPAIIHFRRGLNVIFGASNTGKSFILKTLDFMFGAKSLPGIAEIKGYETVLLGLRLPSGDEHTLYRSVRGGAFRVFDGLHFERPSNADGIVLAAKNGQGNGRNISEFLLASVGLGGKVVAKNGRGEKDSLTWRYVAPYILVNESSIIEERSPILSGQFIKRPVERNVFKALATGEDDSSVISVERADLITASTKGKLALLDELLAELAPASTVGADGLAIPGLRNSLEYFDTAIADYGELMTKQQTTIEPLISRRRGLMSESTDAADRLMELDLTIERFAKLDEVYRSDLARLESIEEGSSLLLAYAGRDCPVCGASVSDQKHAHPIEEIRRTRAAVDAEIAKIERDSRDLQATLQSICAERDDLAQRVEQLAEERFSVERKLRQLTSVESKRLAALESLIDQRDEVARQLAIAERRADLLDRRSNIEIGKVGTSALESGIDGLTAHAFAAKVQAVLVNWGYPGNPHVTYDLELDDIRLNGKERSANGKGVRAILHAAFKVALVLFCLERGLPHPGLVVLDTPLLTYREPLRTPRYGSLTPDEASLKASTLDENFYRHLASLSDVAQFVVLENADPPSWLESIAHVQTFTGEEGTGRFGLFPVTS